jgi:PDZ domain/Aspartyl protease
MKHIFFLFSALILWPGSIYAGGEAKKESAKQELKKEDLKKFVVPFEIIQTKHMVVQVKINGKGPYRLVFDTGAPMSLVSSKVAKEAEVLPKDFKKPLFSLFGNLGQMKIKQMELGELKAVNQSVTVMDHPTVEAIGSLVGRIEGIVGFTFYARYKMSIDYEKKLMTFEPNDYQPGDAMQIMMRKMMAPKSVRETPSILAPAGLLGLRVGKSPADDDAGVDVTHVLSDSPAATAGFKSGDRLMSIDGRWTDSVEDLFLASSQIRPGSPVTAEVVRDGKKMHLKVTLRAGL